MVDKSLIERRFSKAIDTYSQSATVQHRVAKKLSQLFIDCRGDKPINSVLELGCGVGTLTQFIVSAINPTKYYANDLCSNLNGVICGISPNIEFLDGDAESIMLPQSVDAVVSSSAVQWFHNLPKFSNKAANILNSNGLIAISTFGIDNLKEIRECGGETLKYYTFNQLKEIVSCNFDIIHMEEEHIVELFPTPLSVLKHLKATGVTASNSLRWRRSDHLRFQELYSERFTTDTNMVKLTFNPIYIIAKKR